jgi:hypothetical protein
VYESFEAHGGADHPTIEIPAEEPKPRIMNLQNDLPSTLSQKYMAAANADKRDSRSSSAMRLRQLAKTYRNNHSSSKFNSTLPHSVLDLSKLVDSSGFHTTRQQDVKDIRHNFQTDANFELREERKHHSPHDPRDQSNKELPVVRERSKQLKLGTLKSGKFNFKM